MAGGSWSIVYTAVTGATLTASIWNTEFQNIINNQYPAVFDDYSATLAEMRIETDPYPSNVESQATNLGGEIERLRYKIRQIDNSLATLMGASTNTYYYQDSPSGTIVDSLVAKTSDYTLVAADLTGRKKFTNSGTSGQVNFIFPTAAVNYRTSLKVIDAQYVNFVPEVTDSVFIGGTTLSPYTTGTVSTTNGSAVVTGSGTTWTTNAKAGDSFRASGGGLYIIQSVDSNTQITLTSTHSGSLSGVTYGIGKSVKCKVSGFEFIIESYATNKWTIRGVGVQPEIKITMSATQSLPDNTWTLLVYDTEAIDNMSEFTNTAGNYKWIPTLPGKYDIKIINNVVGAVSVQYKRFALRENNVDIRNMNAYTTDYDDYAFSINDTLTIDDSSKYYQIFGLVSGAGDFRGTTWSLFSAIRRPD